MGNLTVKDLFNQMETYKDTVFIVGDKLINRDTSNLNSDILNNKTLRRDPNSFWNYYLNHVVINPDKLNHTGASVIKLLINQGYGQKLVNLTHDDYSYGAKDIINLHGHANHYKCSKCKIEYTQQYINSCPIEQIVCEVCGKPLRPTLLLDGEKYFQTDFDLAKEWLLNTHTVFAAGIDWGETPIVNLLADYANMKETRNRIEKDKRMIVIVGEDELTPNMDDIALFDFVVKGNINEALLRLIALKDAN